MLFIWFGIYFKSHGTGLGNYEVRQYSVTVLALVLLAVTGSSEDDIVYVILPCHQRQEATYCIASTSVFSGFPYTEKDIARKTSKLKLWKWNRGLQLDHVLQTKTRAFLKFNGICGNLINYGKDNSPRLWNSWLSWEKKPVIPFNANRKTEPHIHHSLTLLVCCHERIEKNLVDKLQDYREAKTTEYLPHFLSSILQCVSQTHISTTGKTWYIYHIKIF